MSVKLNDDFFPDLRKIAMERLLAMIPNTAKVVHNTPCNIRSRKNSSSERENKVCTYLVFTKAFKMVTSISIMVKY